MKDYSSFIESKRVAVAPCGFDVPLDKLNPKMFDWQKAVTRWLIHRGRAAALEDCGLGKTIQELEYGKQVGAHTGGDGLILTPLAVGRQTCGIEAPKFGYTATLCESDADVRAGINVTNYQKLHRFRPERFAWIVLDESSILKGFDGPTRKAITDFASGIAYRLAATATPAPNDLVELANHAEFLGVMEVKEVKALFFKQGEDGGSVHEWKLKGHARKAFWKFMAEWSIAIRRPSDIGYDDGAFVLPALNMHDVVVDCKASDGCLFAMEAQTMSERRTARRASLGGRVAATAKLVNESPVEPWLVWCDLIDESSELAASIPGSVEVRGSMSDEQKENALIGFSTGKIRVLITKPSIAGHGMNWQHSCHMVFVGLSDSYEMFYQAVRREWRFGQKRPVECYVVTASTEGAVVTNIRRKERQASEMFDEIVKNMSVHELNKSGQRVEMEYQEKTKEGPGWRMMLGDACVRLKEVEDDSVGLSAYSVPFPGMYAYTNSSRDIGNCKDMLELVEHFKFMMPELLRVTIPGRMTCVHMTQMPVFKSKDGYVGLKDFRGRVITAMEDAGWLYYSEVTIDKNPMLKASRTKESTLLFKTLSKDSTNCRVALADYLLVFKKPGENAVKVSSGTHGRWNPDGGWISSDEWCEWAAPVWYRAMPREKNENQPFQAGYPSRHQVTDGISETDVLGNKKHAPGTRGTADARDKDDEKHLCPLQLGVIERCIKLWSAPGDLVLSPFAGIGSEGYQAIKFNRRFVGIELKPSYYREACENLERAVVAKQEEKKELL